VQVADDTDDADDVVAEGDRIPPRHLHLHHLAAAAAVVVIHHHLDRLHLLDPKAEAEVQAGAGIKWHPLRQQRAILITTNANDRDRLPRHHHRHRAAVGIN